MRKLIVMKLAVLLLCASAFATEAEKEEGAPFKFKASGWGVVENETLENFGDGVASNFDKNDPNNSTSDTNLLLNLNFEATKDNLKLTSILEVGEIFFGDSTTGGAQGTRQKNIEVRELNLEEKYGDNWYFKVGLLGVSADPRGFVFADNISGASVRHEGQSGDAILWAGSATAPTPTTHTSRDTYAGYNQAYKFNEDSALTGFLVYRSTRETFTEKDLVTTTAGKSQYYWAGVNYDQKGILEKGHVQVNAIMNQAEFKAEDTGTSKETDSNSGWLGHIRADYEVHTGWTAGLDYLATSGTDAAGVLGERKSFASPAPSSAYLLTIATSDSADTAAGSTRTNAANHIGRLDLAQGLRLAVVSVEGALGESVNALVRYGQIKTAKKNSATDSDDYGSEVDLKVQYKSSKYTSWILEGAVFDPGSFFANQDNAKLVSLAYRLDF